MKVKKMEVQTAVAGVNPGSSKRKAKQIFY